MSRRMPRSVATIVAAILTVSACGGQSPSVDSPADAVPEGLSDYQSAILADGVVDYAEYERSNLALVECLNSAGFDTIGPLESPQEGFLIVNIVPSEVTPDALDQADVAYRACDQQYSESVFRIYQQQHVPTGSEIVEQARELTDCLVNAGLEGLSDEPTVRELSDRLYVGDGDAITRDQARCFHRYASVLYSLNEG